MRVSVNSQRDGFTREHRQMIDETRRYDVVRIALRKTLAQRRIMRDDDRLSRERLRQFVLQPDARLHVQRKGIVGREGARLAVRLGP